MRVRKTPPKEFTVDRSEWVMGGGNYNDILGGSSLLNDRENACCLGFYAHACGVTWEIMEDVSFPSTLHFKIPLMPSSGRFGYTSEFEGECMGINDNKHISTKKREKLLRKKFAEKGVKIKFSGAYSKELLKLQRQLVKGGFIEDEKE